MFVSILNIHFRRLIGRKKNGSMTIFAVDHAQISPAETWKYKCFLYCCPNSFPF